MNIDQLRAFVTVVDQGSMDVAARRLSVSASAISQRIRALEASTGAVLLNRTSPLTPTEAGDHVLAAARQMLLIEADATKTLAGLTGVDAGDEAEVVAIRVGIGEDALATWFRPVIERAAGWPDVALHLEIADQDKGAMLLETGRVMAAVSSRKTPPGGCRSVPLGKMRYTALCRAELWEDCERDLVRLPMVNFGPDDDLQHQFLRQHGLGRRGRLGARIHQIPDSREFVRAVDAGLGWGMIPDLQRDQLRRELVSVGDEPTFIDVSLYLHRWKATSPRLEKVCRAIADAGRKSLG